MVYLAKSKKEINPLKEISKAEGISFDYLEKIISKLEKGGLVTSKKGVQGGYCLAKNAKKIKVAKILQALEGDTFLVRCASGIKKLQCDREKKCLAKILWKKMQDALNQTINNTTLADLIK